MVVDTYKWNSITSTTGLIPSPRHGHRAVVLKELIVVFGGGNMHTGIFEQIHVYNTVTNHWSMPAVKGDVSPGRAAHGFVLVGSRILVFGGMLEYGKYSNELYELDITGVCWKWKKLKPIESKPWPCPRIGHSFTLVRDNVYLFGGLGVQSKHMDTLYTKDVRNTQIPRYRYLNDLYLLTVKQSVADWTMLRTKGPRPYPRESHSGVPFTDKSGNSYLVVYGGMNGIRLQDIWFLDVEKMTWNQVEVSGVPPLPRSLHSTAFIGPRMVVFGGWVPVNREVDNGGASDSRVCADDSCLYAEHEKQWKCTDTVACLNLELMQWEDIHLDQGDKPSARAGHCAVTVDNRVYVLSGREGCQKEDNQGCCKDLWCLEMQPPSIQCYHGMDAANAQLDCNTILGTFMKYDVKSLEDYPRDADIYVVNIGKKDVKPLGKAILDSITGTLPAFPDSERAAMRKSMSITIKPECPASKLASMFTDGIRTKVKQTSMQITDSKGNPVSMTSIPMHSLYPMSERVNPLNTRSDLVVSNTASINSTKDPVTVSASSALQAFANLHLAKSMENNAPLSTNPVNTNTAGDNPIKAVPANKTTPVFSGGGTTVINNASNPVRIVMKQMTLPSNFKGTIIPFAKAADTSANYSSASKNVLMLKPISTQAPSTSQPQLMVLTKVRNLRPIRSAAVTATYTTPQHYMMVNPITHLRPDPSRTAGAQQLPTSNGTTLYPVAFKNNSTNIGGNN